MKKKCRQSTRGVKRSAGQFRKNTSEKHQRGRYRRVNKKVLDFHSNTEAHTRKKMGQHEEADSTYYSRRISALSETLDIPEHIYEKLMESGPNSTIGGTEITYDAIAAVAAVPKFYLNRHLYIFIKSMNTLSRHCPKNKYDRGGRCPKCFAKHELECIIPTHCNMRTSIPWERRCLICHTDKKHEWGYLCGSI